MNEDVEWYKDCRNFKPKQPDAGYWEHQNKSKFIKNGWQEAEIALRVGKILIICHHGEVNLEKYSWANFELIFW